MVDQAKWIIMVLVAIQNVYIRWNDYYSVYLKFQIFDRWRYFAEVFVCSIQYTSSNFFEYSINLKMENRVNVIEEKIKNWKDSPRN